MVRPVPVRDAEERARRHAVVMPSPELVLLLVQTEYALMQQGSSRCHSTPRHVGQGCFQRSKAFWMARSLISAGIMATLALAGVTR